MSKIWHLKHWLSLGQSADLIANLIDSPSVGIVDLLQLALQHTLKISVIFPDGAIAKVLKPIDEATIQYDEILTSVGGRVMRVPSGGHIFYAASGVAMQAAEDVIALDYDEPYDLTMMYGERFAVEEMFWSLSGREVINSLNIDGSVVTLGHSKNPTYFLLMDKFTSDFYANGTFLPSGKLPKSSVLVLRQTEIRRFVDSIAPESLEAVSNIDIEPKERTSLLNIIGALLELIQSPRGGRDSQSAVIEEILDNYSEKPGLSKRNIEGKFAEARRSLISS